MFKNYNEDVARVLEEIRKIEPAVELVPKSSIAGPDEQVDAPAEVNIRKEISILLVAAVLFIVQLFFEDWFHHESKVNLEIVVVLGAYLLAGWNVLFGALKTLAR